MATTDIERFLDAQGHGQYELTLEEIKNGCKQSHWIWFIFPQMRGLGHSRMSHVYGIASLDEARKYVENPVLNSHLREITCALLQHSEKTAAGILGSIDAMKVRSSMTLFDAICPDDIYNDVLLTFYNGRRCSKTLFMIEQPEY